MKILLLNLFGFMLAIYCPEAMAQNAITITGIVSNQEGKGLESVVISLHHAGDSSLAKAVVSDENGAFEIIPGSAGKFFLLYSATGYETYSSAVFEIAAGQSWTAAEARLKTASTQLKGVTITAHKQLVVVKPGKMVFNVHNSINASGSNALELLQKSPGIVVDNSDRITMKGKTGVSIYVDGKISQLN